MEGKNSQKSQVSLGFTQNVESVHLRSKQDLATETCYGRMKEINLVNQATQTKLNWKHTWDTPESRLKYVCMHMKRRTKTLFVAYSIAH